MPNKLVDDLVQEVRDGADEDDTSDLSTARVLRALNRGQQRLTRLAARYFEPMFRTELETSDFQDSHELVLPDTTNGWIVDQVQVKTSSTWVEIPRASMQDTTALDIESTSTSIPVHYAVEGNRIKLYPYPSTGITIRIRYQFRPPELVLPQGRITSIDSDNATVTLDSLGDDLTTSISNLKAFVNWVDGSTGQVRATLQVSAIDTDQSQVTFKTSGLDRSTVFNQSVATATPSDGAQDDYLCLAEGTCIPYLYSDYDDYLVQYAVVSVKRAKGERTQEDFAHLKELESDVKRMWSGRQSHSRVKRRSPFFGHPANIQSLYR